MTLETTAEVEKISRVVDSAGATVAPSTEQLQKQIQTALANPDGATVQTYTTGSTSAEQLPDLSIAGGVTALLVWLPANTGTVFLGDDTNQFVPLSDVGQAFEWEGSTVSDLYITADNSGDGVGIIFEGSQ